MSEKTFFDFIWKIENFAFCLEKQGCALSSPAFAIHPKYKTEFQIDLYSIGEEEEIKYIQIYLCKEDSDSRSNINSLLFDIAFLNYEGEAVKSEHGFEWDCKMCADEYGSDAFILRKEVILEKTRQFLPQGVLTVLCRIRGFNGELMEAGQCIARTRIGVEHRAFDCAIDGKLNLSAEVDKTITVVSVQKQYPSVTMRLVFNPDLFYDGPLRLQIIQLDSDRHNFMVSKISLINEQGDVVLCAKDQHFFAKKTGQQIWDFPLFLRKSYLIARKNSLLPSGILTLRCEYTMSVGPIDGVIESLTYGPRSLRMINSSIDESCGVPKPISSSLNNDLQNLHKNKKLCDVNLKVEDGESFSAHKAILIARSPVFEKMFTSDMKENTTGLVSISDLDANTVKQMLLFIYTDSVDDVEAETALKLYFAADKYQLESLKELCSSYLSDHLEQSNVCDVLVLADLHKDHCLKGKVEEFIFFNESEIIRSEKWKELMKSNSELALETLYHLHLKKT